VEERPFKGRDSDREISRALAPAHLFFVFFPRTARAISGNFGRIAEYFSHSL
jgi:hypothetical protein